MESNENMINTLPKSLIEAAEKHITHINVDGEMKHRYNSEGNLIHKTDEGIKNFHRWFGDSDSVDEQGRPKVMYHGTPALDRSQSATTSLPFNEFSKSDSGVISFSKNHKFAEQYASTKSQDAGMDKSPYVFSTYLKTKTFDPSNQEHIDQIKPHLGSTVKHQGKYGWSAWGDEKEHPVDSFIEKLQGIHDIFRPLTKEMHEKAEIGKTMTLDGGQIYVHHKTPTKLYYSPSYQMGILDEHKEQLKSAAQQEPEKSETYEFKFKHLGANPWDMPKKQKVNLYHTTYIPGKEKGSNWEYTENDQFKNAAMKAGFTAVKQTENKNENIAVFDKSHIKSVNNTGSFSHPTKIDK
jgi:hypothetical protein